MFLLFRKTMFISANHLLGAGVRRLRVVVIEAMVDGVRSEKRRSQRGLASETPGEVGRGETIYNEGLKRNRKNGCEGVQNKG